MATYFIRALGILHTASKVIRPPQNEDTLQSFVRLQEMSKAVQTILPVHFIKSSLLLNFIQFRFLILYLLILQGL